MASRNTKAMGQRSIWTRSVDAVRARFIAAHFAQWQKRRVSLRKRGRALETREIGDYGERWACKAIWAAGGQVRYRNFFAPSGGEVDIVAREGQFLCFIEVKTRTYRNEGRPADAVDLQKQELIERGGRYWLKLLGNPPLASRYDIVEVFLVEGELPEVKWVRNAF